MKIERNMFDVGLIWYTLVALGIYTERFRMSMSVNIMSQIEKRKPSRNCSEVCCCCNMRIIIWSWSLLPEELSGYNNFH